LGCGRPRRDRAGTDPRGGRSVAALGVPVADRLWLGRINPVELVINNSNIDIDKIDLGR